MKPKFTRLHRFLHWSIGGILLLSFVTGFLHDFWMSKLPMAHKIAEGIPNTTISREQGLDIARSISNPMWKWHIYAGYAIVVLFLARIIYMLIKGIRFPHPFKGKSLKIRLKGMVYLLFYIFIAIETITGFYHLWGTNNDWRHLSSTIHRWAFYWFPIFIILHLIGIYILERSNKKGITSKMIGGD